MKLYEGTGFFVSAEEIAQIKLATIVKNHPGLENIFGVNATGKDEDFLSYLKETNYLIDEDIVHYDEAVVFVGSSEVLIEEATAGEKDDDDEGSDDEKIRDLLANEGYDYAINHHPSGDSKLEALEAILRENKLISGHEVIETYYFLAPYPA